MKKAQVETSFPLKEIFELLLRIIALLALISILAGVISVLNRPEAKHNAVKDMERVVVEMQDLQDRETIYVPVLAHDYMMGIWSTENARAIEPSCPISKSHCACVKKDSGELIQCMGFSLDAEVNGNAIDFDEENIVLSRDNDVIVFDAVTYDSAPEAPDVYTEPDPSDYPDFPMDADGCAELDNLQCEFLSGKSHGTMTSGPDCIIIHYTVSGGTLEQTVDYFSGAQYVPQYTVARDGRMAQLSREDDILYHASCSVKSICPEKVCGNPPEYTLCPNNHCVGIEVVNWGFSCRPDSTDKVCIGPETNEFTGTTAYWEAYTDEQIESLAQLVYNIAARNSIPLDRDHIVGHDQVTIGKNDPGPAFDWEGFMDRMYEIHAQHTS